VSRFPELCRSDFERFLEAFSRPGTLKFRNNKWIGLNAEGRPFAVHVKITASTGRTHPARRRELY
jgi:hypothetical protein